MAAIVSVLAAGCLIALVCGLRTGWSSLFLLLATSVLTIWLRLPGIGSVASPELISLVLLLFRFDLLRGILRHRSSKLVLGFFALQLASLAWSPGLKGGVAWILSEVPFLGALLAVISLPRERAERAFRAGLIVAVLIPVLIITARLDHPAAIAFYKSGVGRLVVGPGASTLFTTGSNNVLDAARAGGLFLNANVASMCCGVLFMLTLAQYLHGRSRLMGVCTLLDFSAIFFTGSRTGEILAVTAVLAITAFGVPLGPWLKAFRAAVIVAIPVVALAILRSSAANSSGGQSVDIRTQIWSASAHLFSSHPVLGLGFGGWAIAFAPYAYSLGYVIDYPPHNLFIYTWSQSGIVAVALIPAVWIALIRDTAGRSAERYKTTCAWIALGWVALHGMADNTTLFGDVHTAAFIGVGFGLLLLHSEVARANHPIPRRRIASGHHPQNRSHIPRDPVRAE